MKKLLEYLTKIPIWLFVLAVFGIGLLLVPDVEIPTFNSEEESITIADYEEELELELLEFVTQIEGVSEVSIMVTLEAGEEHVYATETKSNVNLLSDSLSDDQKRVENQNDNEDSFIIVTNASGSEEPVLIKKLEPVVKGVAIVCKGGENDIIRQKIIESVSIALGLSSNRVSVVGK